MRRITMWGLIAVLGIPVLSLAQDQTVPQATGNVTVTPKDADPAALQDLILFAGADPASAPAVETKDSKYWIGLSCAPVDDTLRAQMGLEAGGLAIRHIADNSPAKDAGLLVHDIITQ